MNHLYLIGFMGSGKSSVAIYLERTHGLARIEMDRDIEAECGKTIAQIFAEDGEEFFRQKETLLLEKIAQRDGLVVSCGGGVPLRKKNVEIMRASGTIVCLQAPPEVLLKRLRRSHRRPLVEERSEEEIRALMQEREELYRSVADHVIDVEGRTIPEIGEEVKTWIR